ncbi:hypothetical protein PR002_g8567 [Phytophthora rubi]|uniref:Uncharacterized protein n=1 Tax=Phytophthora rubi TaxID=129364 RepID=A0A6A3MPZ4_9STRA|nr:hypothetical protein PR002_g8567 [Phytophthora rubi]
MTLTHDDDVPVALPPPSLVGSVTQPLVPSENGGRRQTREAARGRAALSSWKRGEEQQAAPARDSGVDAVAIPRARAPSSLFK